MPALVADLGCAKLQISRTFDWSWRLSKGAVEPRRRHNLQYFRIMQCANAIDELVNGHVLHGPFLRSEEHTSELQSLMRISYAVFCLKKKNNEQQTQYNKQAAHTLSLTTTHTHT